MPTLAIHGINRDSVGNYHVMDEESTGEMVIPPGITRLFEQGIHAKKVYFAGNYQIRDKKSIEGMVFRQELPACLR
jgi:hypothetical protein